MKPIKDHKINKQSIYIIHPHYLSVLEQLSRLAQARQITTLDQRATRVVSHTLLHAEMSDYVNWPLKLWGGFQIKMFCQRRIVQYL